MYDKTTTTSGLLDGSAFDARDLVSLLRQRGERQAERLAYTFLTDGETAEESLTYGELDERARAVGAMLQGRGLGGERVLLLYPPGLEYVTAFWGCLYAGAVAVPVYPPRQNQSLRRLEAVAADAQAKAALTAAQYLSRKDSADGDSPVLSRLSWLTAAGGGSAGEWRPPVISADTPAFLQYTSGSTAEPKGVMLSHGNLLHNERMIREAFRQTEQSVIVGWLPLYHDMGLIGNVLQAAYVGARCVLMSPVSFLQDPARWLAAITRYKATTSGGPNFAYDLCARKIPAARRESLDLSSWAVAFNGAEPIRHDTLERFAAAFAPCGFRREAFFPCYGLAEATLFVAGDFKAGPPVVRAVEPQALELGRVADAPHDDASAVKLVGSGRAADGQRVLVVNPETLRPCAAEEVGEIWVSGPSVARGYWNRPEESEHTFGAYLADGGGGPYLRTGDLGFLEDGELFVTGRLKDLIIVRGRNYYPQDIERTVEESHGGLRPGCGAAFSVELDGEERLVVVQETERHPKADPAEMIGAIRQAVADAHEVQVYAVALVRLGAVPKTSSGKLRRGECRAKFLSGQLGAVSEWRAGAARTGDAASAPTR
ncbi:MAG TPA: fatty acyl-AMP ligase, partial [Pyrinomonadaceae bacterium]